VTRAVVPRQDEEDSVGQARTVMTEDEAREAAVAAQDAELRERLTQTQRAATRRTLNEAAVAVLVAVALAALTFAPFSDALRSQLETEGLSVLAVDQGQYFQNYVNAINVLFSLLASNTFTFLYTQQESVYLALFEEVSVAKALIEQIAFVSRGREAYALDLLGHVERYVRDDLRELRRAPAMLLARRPADDPLESVMWLTSVGAPGVVYETVKDLRSARGARLGALQRKLPTTHFVLLAILGGADLSVFPLLAAATGSAQRALNDDSLLAVQTVLFVFMTSGIALVLRLLYALWIPTSSAYNVDGVLAVMVAGLEAEIDERKAACRRSIEREAEEQQQNAAGTASGDDRLRPVSGGGGFLFGGPLSRRGGGSAFPSSRDGGLPDFVLEEEERRRPTPSSESGEPETDARSTSSWGSRLR